jgi:hypothetical protein
MLRSTSMLSLSAKAVRRVQAGIARSEPALLNRFRAMNTVSSRARAFSPPAARIGSGMKARHI